MQFWGLRVLGSRGLVFRGFRVKFMSFRVWVVISGFFYKSGIVLGIRVWRFRLPAGPAHWLALKLGGLGFRGGKLHLKP